MPVIPALKVQSQPGLNKENLSQKQKQKQKITVPGTVLSGYVIMFNPY
jgi:hypothetical protein